MMEFINLWQEESKVHEATLSVADKVKFVQILSPFAPFMADELFETITAQVSDNHEYDGVHVTSWPEFDAQKATEDEIIIPVQINGKVRAQLSISAHKVSDTEYVLEQAIAAPGIEKYLTGVEVKKKIYVPAKIVSLVV